MFLNKSIVTFVPSNRSTRYPALEMYCVMLSVKVALGSMPYKPSTMAALGTLTFVCGSGCLAAEGQFSQRAKAEMRSRLKAVRVITVFGRGERDLFLAAVVLFFWVCGLNCLLFFFLADLLRASPRVN